VCTNGSEHEKSLLPTTYILMQICANNNVDAEKKGSHGHYECTGWVRKVAEIQPKLDFLNKNRSSKSKILPIGIFPDELQSKDSSPKSAFAVRNPAPRASTQKRKRIS
jgi:hypothetical protein